MVIVNLIGGLGNQLFQYALGRRLAHLHNTSLKLDPSGFDTYYKLHKYSLKYFNVEEVFASRQEIKKYRNLFSRALTEVDLRIFKYRSGDYYKRPYVKEKNLSFDENILKTPSDVYLEGYWQTEKYFREISDILRKEFTFKIPPSVANQRMGDAIRSHNSVSIHIRRSDYITDRASSKALGLCDIPYYKRAVSYVAERVEAPHFYVFSDDMNWVRSNFALDFPVTYADINNADTNYEDLRLMSSCKHNIIANSTFSWWGAWLNESEKKIVIAPRNWFNDTSKKSTDLVPENWVQL